MTFKTRKTHSLSWKPPPLQNRDGTTLLKCSAIDLLVPVKSSKVLQKKRLERNEGNNSLSSIYTKGWGGHLWQLIPRWNNMRISHAVRPYLLLDKVYANHQIAQFTCTSHSCSNLEDWITLRFHSPNWSLHRLECVYLFTCLLFPERKLVKTGIASLLSPAAVPSPCSVLGT